MSSPESKQSSRSRNSAKIAEMHHRIRNALQTLISYLNLIFAGRPAGSVPSVQKLVQVVHTLAFLQDLSLEQLTLDEELIGLRPVVTTLARRHGVYDASPLNEMPDYLTTYKQVCTIALILNELLDNATRHGKGDARVELFSTGDGTFVLRVTNQVDQSVTVAPAHGAGLRLVELLSKADLNAQPKILIDEGKFGISIELPAPATIVNKTVAHAAP